MVKGDAVVLDGAHERERAFRGQTGVGFAQPLAHDPMQDQGEEADGRVRADAIGQSVVDRADLPSSAANRVTL